MQKVKLVWDFFGPDSKNTAQHHLIHLSEFSKDKSVNFYVFDTKHKPVLE